MIAIDRGDCLREHSAIDWAAVREGHYAGLLWADARGCSPVPTAAASRPPTMYTLIVTAKLNDVYPQAWRADVLARIAELPHTRMHELLPWNWKVARHRILAA